jgi:hypothetical protein
MISSLAWSKTTIVMVPLVALKENLQEKAGHLGLSHAIWEDLHEKTPPSSLILVSLESIDHRQFMNYCQRLISHGQLDRIIWDEAHMIPLDQGFRPIMKRLHQMRLLEVPMVFCTATLPEHLEVELGDLMVLRRPLVLRADVNRPNIHYGVRICAGKTSADHLHEILDFIGDFNPHRGPIHTTPTTSRGPTKVIIYFMMVEHLEAFHKMTADFSTIYHGQLDAEIRSRNLDEFEQGKWQILCATSALSAGFDPKAGVILVIQYPRSWGITNFMQESGRLARQEGSSGYSMVFTTTHEMKARDHEGKEAQLMREYLQEGICRRSFLNRIFNQSITTRCRASQGTIRPTSSRGSTIGPTIGPSGEPSADQEGSKVVEEELPCDLCQPRIYEMKCIYKEVIELTKEQAHQTCQLNYLLNKFTRQCLICYFISSSCLDTVSVPSFLSSTHTREEDHSWKACLHRPLMQPYYDQIHQMVQKRAPPQNSCHFTCLIPTRVCHEWVKEKRKRTANKREKHQCYGEGLMILFYALCLSHPEFINQWGEEWAYQASGFKADQAFCQWAYQYNRKMFGTEALWGVQIFYLWGSRLVKSGRFGDAFPT